MVGIFVKMSCRDERTSASGIYQRVIATERHGARRYLYLHWQTGRSCPLPRDGLPHGRTKPGLKWRLSTSEAKAVLECFLGRVPLELAR
jgi:hypothetical protein